MTQLDLYYRSFGEFIKSFEKDRESAMLRDTIVRAEEQDKVTVITMKCTIDEDWVDAVEHGLVYIGKAIDEERQFIRSNGEIEIIEKVKHISRESVEHLSRHSNFITREVKENDDIVPEKLYTVERMNDYHVYENRFLYMMLCHLRDFVSYRYNQIVKLTNTYRGDVTLRKSVREGKHRLDYQVNLKETREDDWYLRSHNPVGTTIDRLERILRSVHFYLNTPLMTDVAKADKLKPPIVKTNVLRMDKNFKEVVALYEYLIDYRKDGFLIEQEEHTLNPLTDKIAGELASPILLLSFLAYEHGLGLEEYLKQQFMEEESRRQAESKRLLQEQLVTLRKRIRANGGNYEEYLLLLEKRNRELEKDSEQLVLAKAEIEGLNNEIKGLHDEIETLHTTIDELNSAHAEEVASLNEQIENIRKEQAEENIAHAAALVEVERVKHEEIARIESEKQTLIEECNVRIDEKDQEIGGLKTKLLRTEKESTLLSARLTALRNECGMLTETNDYTSEAAFEELERQFETLGELVRGEWKDAKKLLRQEFLLSLKKSFTEKIKRNSRSQKNSARNREISDEYTKENDKNEMTKEHEMENVEQDTEQNIEQMPITEAELTEPGEKKDE